MQELISYIMIGLLLTVAIHARSSGSSDSTVGSSPSSDSLSSTESSTGDPCSCNPCLNSGVCVSKGSGYKCQCPPGYGGKNCQKEIKPSKSSSSETNGSD